jgi:hypothetical protein
MDAVSSMSCQRAGESCAGKERVAWRIGGIGLDLICEECKALQE